ncbi:hypothetical protein [Hyphococcus luteus]|jgi:hypothetical protein|nr:hypothetical protein [Marinicaulis flavus]
MRFANSDFSFGKFAGFVNGLVVVSAIVLIGSGYVSALGSFAGVA